MLHLSPLVGEGYDGIEALAFWKAGYKIGCDHLPKSRGNVERLEFPVRFLIPRLHPLASVAVTNPFNDVGLETRPIVIPRDNLDCARLPRVCGLSGGVEFVENLLSKVRRNVYLAHICPEVFITFPSPRNRVVFSFEVEFKDEWILSLFIIDSGSKVSLVEGIGYDRIDLLRFLKSFRG